MLKEVLKKYLDVYFKEYEDYFKSLPALPYDEDEPSDLYVGEIDKEGWIQWQYAPVDRIIDFSGLEEEYNIHISEELKEYYNSYYFLELWGFRGNEGIRFDKVDDTTDVLAEFRGVLNDNEDMIEIGTDNRNSSICVKIDSGQVISKYWEFEEEFVLADSLSELFLELKPSQNSEE
ncbi:MAG: SecY-interacting protein Syd [Lachnospiraceae bacterium]|nr:SecY-interacting protein Syd [Lachnospiraceae bacterium]MDE7201988.1 SecY-interacting protein Syd [Lachnospiraceae bacterium]